MSNDDTKNLREILREELQPINERLGNIEKEIHDPETGLKALKEGQDDLIADVYEVKQLAKQTLDVVKMEQNARKKEIDEMREELSLPSLQRN